jgi:hypothetical protein
VRVVLLFFSDTLGSDPLQQVPTAHVIRQLVHARSLAWKVKARSLRVTRMTANYASCCTTVRPLSALEVISDTPMPATLSCRWCRAQQMNGVREIRPLDFRPFQDICPNGAALSFAQGVVKNHFVSPFPPREQSPFPPLPPKRCRGLR